MASYTSRVTMPEWCGRRSRHLGQRNQAERLKARVTERLQRLWPQIGEVSFDYVWNGYVGMTTDHFSRIHRLGPNAYGWTGCNGRAVALTMPLGRELAKAVQGVPENELALPFTRPVSIPAHGLMRKRRDMDAAALPLARCAGDRLIPTTRR